MWIFLKGALRGFVAQGSVFPSSPFLGERMIRPVEMKEGVRIVELGAGVGNFTQKLLSRLPPSGRIIAFEINHELAEHLRRNFSDPRLVIIEDDAARLRVHLKRLGIAGADYVISGLPLGNFRRPVRNKILSEILECLNDDGLYVQFQYFLASWLPIRNMFDARISGYEFLNLPPAFVYECRKNKTMK